MIKPTPGRVVWYYPPAGCESSAFVSAGDGVPHAAHIARVWSDTCVNLMVIDANGNPRSRTSVLLVQGDNPRPASEFCEWMPYQIGQAKAQPSATTVSAAT